MLQRKATLTPLLKAWTDMDTRTSVDAEQAQCDKVFWHVLTWEVPGGAGVSTGAGIADFRSGTSPKAV